jgi:outer membrane protein
MKQKSVYARTALAVSVLLAASLAHAVDPVAAREKVPTPTATATGMMAAGAGEDPCRLPETSGPLSLVEVVERALCHNPQTRRAWANVRASSAQVGVQRSAYLPALTGTLGSSRENGNTSLQALAGPSAGIEATRRDGSLNLAWVLFDFGLRSANLENARELLAAAGATHDATLQSVFLSAAQAYYDVLTSVGALEASKESEIYARNSFMAADAKHKAGAGTLADKLQAQTNYAQAILRRVKADGELKDAHGALAIAMGLNANTSLEVKAENRELPNADFQKSVDALIEDAKRSHPVLIAAQAQLKAARAKVQSAKAEGLPSVSLNGSISRNDRLAARSFDTHSQNKSIGVQIKIPLFEGFGRAYHVRSAQAEVEARSADLENSEKQVSLDVWRSYQALLTETENLKATDELLRSAEQSFKVAEGGYRAGVGSILELLNAQSALAGAQQQRIQALSSWRTMRLQLAASLGNLGFWAIR